MTRRIKVQFEYFLQACFLSLPCIVPAISGADAKPMRSECIVGFSLDWSHVKADRKEVRNSLYLGPHGAQRTGVNAAIALDQSGTRLYFQFTHDCDQKERLSEEVIKFWRSNGLDLPNFKRMEGPILPSLDTIEVWGPFWEDKPKGTP